MTYANAPPFKPVPHYIDCGCPECMEWLEYNANRLKLLMLANAEDAKNSKPTDTELLDKLERFVSKSHENGILLSECLHSIRIEDASMCDGLMSKAATLRSAIEQLEE